MEHQKSYFWSPGLSGVTIATSLSGSTRDFLKLLFNVFPYNEILKVSKVKSDLIFETSTHRYLQLTNFSQVSEGVWELRTSEI